MDQEEVISKLRSFSVKNTFHKAIGLWMNVKQTILDS